MTALFKRPRDGWAMLAGHYEPAVLIAFLAVFTASNLTRYRYPALTGLAYLAAAPLLAAMLADARRHRPGLCERCAAGVPLDPQAAVTRWRAALRVHHSRRLRAAATVIIIAWGLAGIAAVLADGARETPGGPWYYAAVILGIPAWTLGAAFVLIMRKHRQLCPWCPYCGWDDGGEEETTPEPDPRDDGVPSPAG